jgi:biotin carboxyl carrier protein
MKRLVNGKEAELEPSGASIRDGGDRLLVSCEDGVYSALAIKKGDAVLVSFRGRQYTIEPVKAARKHHGKDHSGDLISPLPGAVVDVLVAVGEAVKTGDKIVVLEAMKTQQSFAAPFDGKVAEIRVKKGDQVAEGTLLAVVDPIEG